jgi:tetratricopeptide (TPR) repeat protein
MRPFAQPLRHRRLLAIALAILVLEALGTPAPAQDPPPHPPPATSNAEDPTTLFARGQSLLQAGDAAGAAAVFETMLARGIEHPAVRSNLGAAYSRLGRLEEAVEQQRRALELAGGNADVRLNLAIALSKAGRIPEAAEEAARVLEAKPDHRSALLLLADCRLRMGESSEVVELLDPIAGRAVEDEAVAYLLGMALMHQGRLERAQRVIDGILRRETPQAHLLMATMSVAAGDCTQALKELDRASELGPRLPTQSFLRGQCLMERNDWAGAADAFGAELERNPNHFEAQLMYGTLLREENRNEEALAHLERAERLRPGHVLVQLGLGSVLAALGRDAEALGYLERAVAERPDDMQAHVQLAGVYQRLGRIEDAAREGEAVKAIVAAQQARAAEGAREAITSSIGSDLSGSNPDNP